MVLLPNSPNPAEEIVVLLCDEIGRNRYQAAHAPTHEAFLLASTRAIALHELLFAIEQMLSVEPLAGNTAIENAANTPPTP